MAACLCVGAAFSFFFFLVQKWGGGRVKNKKSLVLISTARFHISLLTSPESPEQTDVICFRSTESAPWLVCRGTPE